MSVDSDRSVSESPDVEAIGRRLGEAIAELPEYDAFETAKRAVEEDEEAQRLIKRFEEERQTFAVARQAGHATEEDLESIKETQAELHSLPVMEEYLERQETLVDRLQSVNEAISDPLVIDFGGEAGGCCKD